MDKAKADMLTFRFKCDFSTNHRLSNTPHQGKIDTAAVYAFDTTCLTDRLQPNGGTRLGRYRPNYGIDADADDGTSSLL